MKIVGIIPARYESTRFPGKPLALIGGKTMIQRVYEQCLKCSELDEVIVATDDKRIFDHVNSFGKAILTANTHESGTDRCAEVVSKLDSNYDYVINIQGDEPFISPNQIKLLIDEVAQDKHELGTLVKLIDDVETLLNANTPKVVLKENKEAIYFSRETIPHVRGVDQKEWLSKHTFYKHIGIYAYRTDVLKKIVKLKQGTLEQIEKLEQLRWLENGYKIKVGITDEESIGIDTPEDLEKVKSFLN